MRLSRKITDPNPYPRRLTLSQMWELYRILKPAEPIRVPSIIKNVPPRQIAEAMKILYGSSGMVFNGLMLIHLLYKGLDYNHFTEFLKVTQRPK